MTVTDYQSALAYIHSRPRLHKEANLNRIGALLDALGRPQEGQQFIHVTGTNGKGSVVKMVTCLLEATGLNVGRFTSPFITRFNERIAINQTPIPDAQLVAEVQKIEQQVSRLQAADPEFAVTEFETITAIMFDYFKQQAVDIAVIEVGIGGLYDSTNVLTPQIAVITSVGLDHQNLLGPTLGAIATHKAGIIKGQHPVVIGRLPSEAQAVITETAERLASPLAINGVDFEARLTKTLPTWGQQLIFSNQANRLQQLQIPLMGDYQIQNAAVALQTYLTYLAQQHLPVDILTIKRGLKQATWPGRFEKINDEPLIILDGAHNPEGIAELVKTIRHQFKGRDIRLLFGALGDKNLAQMLPPLKKVASTLLLTTVPDNPRAATPEQYAQVDSEIAIEPDWPVALTRILADISTDDVLVITGSLYLISAIRSYFKGEIIDD